MLIILLKFGWMYVNSIFLDNNKTFLRFKLKYTYLINYIQLKQITTCN